MKIETYKCDIEDCDNTATHINEKIQVIFRTEQNEGTPINGSLSIEKLDICKDCYEKLISGKIINAYGAQGFNKYYINYIK